MATKEALRRAQVKYVRKLSGAVNPSGETHRGACEICGRVPGAGEKANAYDHDHSTGAFRGWLCSNCNTGLGRFKDSPELLEKAADYLRRQR